MKNKRLLQMDVLLKAASFASSDSKKQQNRFSGRKSSILKHQFKSRPTSQFQPSNHYKQLKNPFFNKYRSILKCNALKDSKTEATCVKDHDYCTSSSEKAPELVSELNQTQQRLPVNQESVQSKSISLQERPTPQLNIIVKKNYFELKQIVPGKNNSNLGLRKQVVLQKNSEGKSIHIPRKQTVLQQNIQGKITPSKLLQQSTSPVKENLQPIQRSASVVKPSSIGATKRLRVPDIVGLLSKSATKIGPSKSGIFSVTPPKRPKTSPVCSPSRAKRSLDSKISFKVDLVTDDHMKWTFTMNGSRVQLNEALAKAQTGCTEDLGKAIIESSILMPVAKPEDIVITSDDDEEEEEEVEVEDEVVSAQSEDIVITYDDSDDEEDEVEEEEKEEEKEEKGVEEEEKEVEEKEVEEEGTREEPFTYEISSEDEEEVPTHKACPPVEEKQEEAFIHEISSGDDEQVSSHEPCSPAKVIINNKCKSSLKGDTELSSSVNKLEFIKCTKHVPYNEITNLHTYPRQCDICKRSYKTRFSFSKHKSSCTPVENPCPVCGKIFQELSSLIEHVKLCGKDCSDCKSTFKTRRAFQKHNEIFQKRKKCIDCRKNFANKCLFNKHKPFCEKYNRESETLLFDCMWEFETWMREESEKQSTSFEKSSGSRIKDSDGTKKYCYRCKFSNKSVSKEGENSDHKLNKCCRARLDVQEYEDGKLVVTYFSTHLHPSEKNCVMKHL
ncbi:zinc finger protein 184 [Nilaparvata lugens]|uniref:zinc finger protein 184 n=1 Tax=Nilaparvata lugens TaxID=108931 RepID=UPI00193DFD67|nr:zinc finger protein 184 [Nilaparvata lugens]